jgi:DNA helicase-2/ATP-dependent DNA helicase PcrA
MVGLEEGLLPHSRSLESKDPEDMAEERRLTYVGVTRAKRRLYLVYCFKRSLWGGTETQTPSRFLEEIPTDLLSGMVDKRGRREQSYKRMTSWGDDDPDGGRRRGDAGRDRETKAPSTPAYDWSRSSKPAASGTATPAGGGRAAYWSPGGGKQPAKPAAAASGGRQPQFKRRDSVQHPTFGVGTVIESALTRDDEEVTVAFPGVGIKKLLVSLANLTRL